MTERLNCITHGCAGKILPATAERTGGYCMPCVQEKSRKEYEEYVRTNRRDVNAFEGLTEPVAIITVLHRRHDHDPLVNWIPYPEPVDQLYTRLTEKQQDHLATYAAQCIRDDNDEGEDILRCLAAFTDAQLEGCLAELLSQGKYYPSIVFRRAGARVRDTLISALEPDDANRNHILLALAWIGDETVVALFNSWRIRPPHWVGSLYVPPERYSHEAGWEIDEAGQRRDLFFTPCTSLVSGASGDPSSLIVATSRSDKCSCGRTLINLFELSPRKLGLNVAMESIQVATCDICSAYRPMFAARNDGLWSLINEPTDVTPNEEYEVLPHDSLRVGPTRSAHFATDQFLPTTFSQLGGLPCWIQDHEYLKCPKCSRTMCFLAQIANEDIQEYGEGLFYSFVCTDCETTATTYQQT